MERKPQPDDELVMSLVESALAQPENQRESYLERACSGNQELFSLARDYVQWEARMHGFLLDPLYSGAEEENPFERGQILDGRFRIEREVARGGMGIVYEAYDERLDRRIALKCARSGFRKRLPPEVRLASEISHPNVCKIFEIHTVSTPGGEVDFLTMEFLEGETLAARLAKGPLTEAEARVIRTQICAGLAEAHRNRVVHGDLKSNNVILTRDTGGGVRAVITDFGLARRPLGPAEEAFDAVGSSQAGGTPDYMAPELWKGEKPTAASDVYALGVILYELASGRKPYAAEVSPEQRLQRKPPALHTKWDRILARCLDPVPARRFSSAVEIERALAPSSTRRWILAAAAAAIQFVATGVSMYQRGAGPRQSWRLTMPPVESSAETKHAADRLSGDAAGLLAHLKGGKIARLTVVPFDPKAQATYYVHAMLAKKDNKMVLRAWLTDAHGVNHKEWTAEYGPGEMRYAPVALAGMVTSDLGLPPLGVGASVNSAAANDYWSGLWYTGRNSTIDQALPLLERAVKEDPDSPLTFAALAEARQWKYFVTRDWTWMDRAKEAEREAERRNPDVEQLHRVAGLLRYREGLSVEAEKQCLRAIELDPMDAEAHRVLGQAYEKTNRLEPALAEYRKAVELGPQDFRNEQLLGTFYYLRADYAEALPHFQRMVQLAPGEPVAHQNLASAYLGLDRLADAEYQLQVAISVGETADEWHNLGAVQMEQGNSQGAADSILRALKIGGEQSLYEMDLGTAYHLLKRTAESREAYQRALALTEKELARDTSDSKTLSYQAFICARLGYLSRAESEIKQALQRSPTDADVRFMAVAAYDAMGDTDAAFKLLETFSFAELKDVKLWPDMADLSENPRFLKLWASFQTK